MKIVVDSDIPYIKGRLEAAGIDTVYRDQWGFDRSTVSDADAIMIRTRTRCNRELLEGTNVKLIATATIGMDQIDTEWCSEAGIEVCNAPGCNAPGVAQYVWSSLLRVWNVTTEAELAGKTLGIVGCGNVGSIVKDWAERLQVRVLLSDPPKGINYPLDRLMAESDAVTLHTPLSRTGQHSTYHLIGAKQLAKMRPGTLLVNAARGGVVDFQALKPEVMSGRIKAVVDTWEGEPHIDSELLGEVEYGTCHIAGYSIEGKQRATRMAIEAVERRFGVHIDKSGLAGPYGGTPELSVKRILDSFDPGVETRRLRANPEAFDMLRNDYKLRKEV